MEENLQYFLTENAIHAENVKYAVLKHFLNQSKNPVEWEFQQIHAPPQRQTGEAVVSYYELGGGGRACVMLLHLFGRWAHCGKGGRHGMV